jgi:hypothetical protein
MTSDSLALAAGRRIFRTLFSIDPSTKFLERYCAADLLLANSFSENERKNTDRVLLALSQGQRLRYDLEAIEFASRLTKKLPLLCKRFRLVVMLAECDPNLRHIFVNTRSRRWLAWQTILTEPFIGVWKLLKGLWLLKILRVDL